MNFHRKSTQGRLSVAFGYFLFLLELQRYMTQKGTLSVFLFFKHFDNFLIFFSFHQRVSLLFLVDTFDYKKPFKAQIAPLVLSSNDTFFYNFLNQDFDF